MSKCRSNSHLVMAPLLLFLIQYSVHGTAAAVYYNVLRYGAAADGVTDDSAAFLKAWKAVCDSPEGGILYVPPHANFLLHPTLFSGSCASTKVVVQVEGQLVAFPNYQPKSSSSEYWIKFDNVKGLTFTGGYLDGKGSSLWSCKAANKSNCPFRERSLVFNNAVDLTLRGITSVNSQVFNIVIDSCNNVQVFGLNIRSPGNSPNTDEIHVEQSTGVTIANTDIKTGDDCISIGPGTQNLWIEKVTCGPGHGISIGSLGKKPNEPGVMNVTVKNTIFTGSTNGLRIKSWSRSSNGFAKDIVFDGATMNDVKNPIIINQHYCDSHAKDCPTQNSGVEVSAVTYSNIEGTSATPVAVNYRCSKAAPCRGIKMSNVHLTYNGQPAKSSCDNAYGSASDTMIPPNCLH